MSYENAPATQLLATHCCCCARPLVDAKSVELGVGPDCRKKHGYEKAEVEPDWLAFLAATDGLVAVEEIGEIKHAEVLWRLGGLETRRVANLLVYRVAAELSRDNASWETVGMLTKAIRALGFQKLATIVEERNAAIIIRRKVTPGWGNSRGAFVGGEEIVVEAPYSEAALPILRAVPGRRWDKEAKTNVFPASSARPLLKALAQAYPRARAVGPKGAFVLGRAL